MLFCMFCTFDNDHFRINDRVVSANNVSLEGVDYATAVQVLRDSGQNVSLVVKRRVILPPAIPPNSVLPQNGIDLPKYLNVSLARSKKKEDFGVILGCKIYIKEIIGKTVAEKDGILKEGDEVTKINGNGLENLTLKEAKKVLENSKDRLDLTVKREGRFSLRNGLDHEKNNLMKNGIDHHQPPFVPPPPRPPLPSGIFEFSRLFVRG